VPPAGTGVGGAVYVPRQGVGDHALSVLRVGPAQAGADGAYACAVARAGCRCASQWMQGTTMNEVALLMAWFVQPIRPQGGSARATHAATVPLVT
jgi:hypothetical protein